VKQKFKKLSFVRVSDAMPGYMSHFESGFDAIVKGTSSQLFGDTDIDNYSLYKIVNGKIVDCISWYEEYQLTLIDDNNRDKAEEMIEAYNFRDVN
jgi:hypothetical protein